MGRKMEMFLPHNFLALLLEPSRNFDLSTGNNFKNLFCKHRKAGGISRS